MPREVTPPPAVSAPPFRGIFIQPPIASRHGPILRGMVRDNLDRQRSVQVFGAGAGFAAYLFRKRSTRPATSMSFCFPV